MVWQRSNPMADPAVADVLAAYEAASNARKSTADCYRAGVGVRRGFHPEQTSVYAAQRAVEVILAAKVSLRIPDV
jgi:hypothetical protein